MGLGILWHSGGSRAQSSAIIAIRGFCELDRACTGLCPRDIASGLNNALVDNDCFGSWLVKRLSKAEPCLGNVAADPRGIPFQVFRAEVWLIAASAAACCYVSHASLRHAHVKEGTLRRESLTMDLGKSQSEWRLARLVRSNCFELFFAVLIVLQAISSLAMDLGWGGIPWHSHGYLQVRPFLWILLGSMI